MKCLHLHLLDDFLSFLHFFLLLSRFSNIKKNAWKFFCSKSNNETILKRFWNEFWNDFIWKRLKGFFRSKIFVGMNFISTKRAKRSYCIALKSKQKEIKTKNGDVIFVSNISLERSKIVFLFEYYFQTFLETIFKKIFEQKNYFRTF